MRLKYYFVLWLTLSAILGFEAIQLFSKDPGILSMLKASVPEFKELNLSTDAGRPISLALGWTGFGLILVTNFYILRKRLGFLGGLGRLRGWLDFHIFCGLMGPTLIIFHTGFKVRGLVSISFWSMMTVAISGVVGRYFYGQTVRLKTELKRDADNAIQALEQFLKLSGKPIASTELALYKVEAERFVGVPPTGEGEQSGLFRTLLFSSIGDIRIFLKHFPTVSGITGSGRLHLKDYGLAMRRAVFFENFQKYLGYWHSFHLPFAFFMYVVAVIHVAVALLFGVKS